VDSIMFSENKNVKIIKYVELGKRLNITTDQFHLIIDWEIARRTADVEKLLPLVDRLICKNKIHNLSADKGY